MKEDKPLLIFSSTVSWYTDVQGEEIKEMKRWETRILGRNSMPVTKGPRKSRTDTSGSLNNHVPSGSMNITVTALYNIVLGFWF